MSKKNLCLKSNAPLYDSVERRYGKMHSDIADGTRTDITHDQVTQMYNQEIEDCIDAVEPLEPRTAGVPTDEKVAMGRTRDSVTGEITEPEAHFQSKFGETC